MDKRQTMISINMFTNIQIPGLAFGNMHVQITGKMLSKLGQMNQIQTEMYFMKDFTLAYIN